MTDLHLHSNASDGSLTPKEIVELSVAKGLSSVAIADHDSIEACDEARDLGAAAGIEVVPAVEISSNHKGRDLHLLGYFLDTSDLRLRNFLHEARVIRAERLEEAIHRLRNVGIELKGFRELLAQAPERSLGRGLLARALIDEGHVTTMREAFIKYLGDAGAGHVDRDLPPTIQVIKELRDYGAVVVMAHPGISRADQSIPNFVEAGLAGLEAFHPDHSPEDCIRYRDLAAELGIIYTGGSDCHGEVSDRGVMLGTVTVPDDCLEQLRRLSGQVKSA